MDVPASERSASQILIDLSDIEVHYSKPVVSLKKRVNDSIKRYTTFVAYPPNQRPFSRGGTGLDVGYQGGTSIAARS